MTFLKRSLKKSGEWRSMIHSVDEFREILHRERMRSDRSGIKLCLVAFTLDTSDQQQVELLLLYIKQHLRSTDELGIVSENEMGIILWDTLETGANTYIKKVKSHETARCIAATTIYIYPMTIRSKELELRTVPNVDKRKKCAESRAVKTSNPTEPLEVLFIKRLPRWKRMIDLAGATIGLIALSPLLLATAILIKLTSQGPILFRQERDGLGGKRFTIYKFRTMRADAERLKADLRQFSEQDGPAFKLSNDPRITAIGRYLRKTCIDELPQLWNVIRGDMTLVGPRPLDSKEAAEIEGWGKRRAEVTPGLTCLWQVYGKSKVTFSEWMRMDIRYLKQRTLRRDLQLICKTLAAVISHRASV